MKRGIALLVIGLLGVGLVSAAGEGEEGTGEGAKEVEFYSLAWQPLIVERAQALTAAYSEDNPDVTVKYITGDWGAARELMVTSFASGAGADIFHGITPWALEFGTIGHLEPLNDYVSDEMLNDIDERAWSTMNHPYFDELYAVPFVWESQILIYNKGLYEQAGVNVPPRGEAWTWDQFVTEGKKFDSVPGVRFFATGMTVSQSAENIISYIWQVGEEVMHPNEDGEWVVTFNDDAKAAVTWYRDLINTHNLMPRDVFGLENSDVVDGFNAGSYATYMSGSWARSESFAQAAPFEWGVMPLPYNESRANISQPQVYFLPKYSDVKQEAWEFLEFLINTENMASLAAGDYLFPTRQSSLALEPFGSEEFYWDVAKSAIEHGHPYVAHPAWGEFTESVLGPTLQGILLGQIGVNEGADMIVEEGNAILARFEARR